MLSTLTHGRYPVDFSKIISQISGNIDLDPIQCIHTVHPFSPLSRRSTKRGAAHKFKFLVACGNPGSVNSCQQVSAIIAGLLSCYCVRETLTEMLQSAYRLPCMSKALSLSLFNLGSYRFRESQWWQIRFVAKLENLYHPHNSFIVWRALKVVQSSDPVLYRQSIFKVSFEKTNLMSAISCESQIRQFNYPLFANKLLAACCLRQLDSAQTLSTCQAVPGSTTI